MDKIWNWQQGDWPHFRYDASALEAHEARFLRGYKLILKKRGDLAVADDANYTLELLNSESLGTSAIEGEHLNRDSLQSSLQRLFGLKATTAAIPPRPERENEVAIASLMNDLYRTYGEPLGDKMLWRWHKKLMGWRSDMRDIGRYRRGAEPMRVISGSVARPTVHFEAPPSANLAREMALYIDWYNRTAPTGIEPLPPLQRAGIAHLYFESLHPFEDGNGRIGRALAEKALARSPENPSFVALATTINRNRRAYYDALAQANRKNEITAWLLYFADTVLKSADYAYELIGFTLKKERLLARLAGSLNERQEKAVLRILQEGPAGFEGGLSAKNYIGITGAMEATATRDLRDLVAKGFLTRTGERKGTRYWLQLD